MPSNKQLTGCAGEHFVAYKLSEMNYLVALTRGGSPSVDLMVGTIDGQKAVTIQVKTAQKAFSKGTAKNPMSCWYWHLSSKAKDFGGESVFYAFVDLRNHEGNSTQIPDVFIVPANYVKEHLNTYPRGSSEPTDFWFDILEKDKKMWHEAWHLIQERLTATE